MNGAYTVHPRFKTMSKDELGYWVDVATYYDNEWRLSLIRYIRDQIDRKQPNDDFEEKFAEVCYADFMEMNLMTLEFEHARALIENTLIRQQIGGYSHRDMMQAYFQLPEEEQADLTPLARTYRIVEWEEEGGAPKLDQDVIRLATEYTVVDFRLSMLEAYEKHRTNPFLYPTVNGDEPEKALTILFPNKQQVGPNSLRGLGNALAMERLTFEREWSKETCTQLHFFFRHLTSDSRLYYVSNQLDVIGQTMETF